MKKITLLLLVLAVGCGKSKREKRKEWIKSQRDSVEVQIKEYIDTKFEVICPDSLRYID